MSTSVANWVVPCLVRMAPSQVSPARTAAITAAVANVPGELLGQLRADAA